MKYIDEIDVQIDSWYICVSGVLFASIFIIPNIHFTTYAIFDVVILITPLKVKSFWFMTKHK